GGGWACAGTRGQAGGRPWEYGRTTPARRLPRQCRSRRSAGAGSPAAQDVRRRQGRCTPGGRDGLATWRGSSSSLTARSSSRRRGPGASWSRREGSGEAGRLRVEIVLSLRKAPARSSEGCPRGRIVEEAVRG